MPAFTVSALNHYRDLQKITVLDTRENLDIDRLVTNTKIIAEALARHIYNVSDGNVFGQTLDVSRRHIEAWIDYLTLQPRSPQLLSNKENVLVNTLKETFNKYLRDIKVSYAIPDKRDPDFQFYDSTKGIVNIYSVKPAVFDLVLTLVIILYLGLFYFSVDYFPKVYKIACSLTSNNKKIKTN
ncbi:hypothetical protein NQ317_013264 [Molorchus minor]|uniref:Nicalin n=1 Tax=Molorchus minor TaxID=1323400 RepID=A0ABQ9JXG6_9CUCU|nr:hypothetical protein NQ317_013264 [Molorchus minor]